MSKHTTVISVSSEQGVRPEQQDSYGLIRIGAWECFAIADGYGDKDPSGIHISSEVINRLFTVATSLLSSPTRTVTAETYTKIIHRLYAAVDSYTYDLIPGSTLAVVLHNRHTPHFYTAVLGDSVIALLTPQKVTLNPEEHLHLGKSKLWGSFGDIHHSEHHSKVPECAVFELQDNDAIVMSSDGLYASHEAEGIREEAKHYADLVLNQNYNATDLVHAAQEHKRTDDNATAIVIRLVPKES